MAGAGVVAACTVPCLSALIFFLIRLFWRESLVDGAFFQKGGAAWPGRTQWTPPGRLKIDAAFFDYFNQTHPRNGVCLSV